MHLNFTNYYRYFITGDEYFAELDYIEVVENMKEGYEPEVVNEDNDSTGTDEDFDVEMESMRARNDDSDDEFVAKSYTASVDSESRRYRTRNSVDTRKKTNQAPTNVADKRKERNSSSDEEGGEVRQVKNFMASNTMPLSDDPEDDRVKSIRKMFGKDEAVYIMDAKKAGNIGRYFNVSRLFEVQNILTVCFKRWFYLITAFMWTEPLCAKCVCRHARPSLSLGGFFRIYSYSSWYRAHLELQLRSGQCPRKGAHLSMWRREVPWPYLISLILIQLNIEVINSFYMCLYE